MKLLFLLGILATIVLSIFIALASLPGKPADDDKS